MAEAVRKLALPDARIIAGSVRPFKELLAACEDRELAAEALRCVHANDFVGLDARVAASTAVPRCSTAWTRCWRPPVSSRR